MINKLVMTKGAVFDYEEIVCGMELNKLKFRQETEKLIGNTEKQTLRLVYPDPSSKKELMLFLRRGYDFGIMRLWILEGICETADYEEEMENNGVIKKWLEIEIE